MNQLLTELQQALGGKVRTEEPLARYTTFKIGGPAEYFFEAKTREELVAAILISQKVSLPYVLLGGGTNMLIGDRGVRGLVIRNLTSGVHIRGVKGYLHQGRSMRSAFVEADSGVILNKLVRTTVEEGLAGLEMHLGLPGTVGGAVYMNSKWTHPDGYVGDVVYQATILTPKGEQLTVPKSYFHFAYDSSIIQKTRDVVLGVVFALEPKSKEELWKIANESIAYRRSTQPQGVLSPGCTFKNIQLSEALRLSTPGNTTSAGYLVDHAGCKGMQIGDAQISLLHANFIVNKGKATASDVVQLIERSRAKVKEQFGVTLEEEIVRLGDF